MVETPNEIVTEAIERLCAGTDLGSLEAESVLLEVMRGDVADTQTAAFLVALRAKGETAGELAGLATAMRSLATPVKVDRRDLVDTAGTGGGFRTFNVSTTAALIAAGAGVGVAKHGNRSATSPSGSADLLEQLGIPLDLPPELIARSIEDHGFGFMFAPAHHAATRHVVPVRKALGTRTVFNLLGPLTNPAGASRQVIGVSDKSALEPVAGALSLLGAERAWVVHGQDGLDELSVSAPTDVVEVRAGEISRWVFDPASLGIERSALSEVAGGSPVENAAVTRSVLAGEPGPTRDIALLNAAAAIAVASDDEDLAAALEAAEESVDSGAAAGVLSAVTASRGATG